MHFGIGGITLSTSIVTLFNACVLGILISKKIKMDYKTLFNNLLKMLVAGVFALVACLMSAYAYDKFIELPKYINEITKIILVLTVCTVVYVPLNLGLKMEYAKELADRVKNKIRKEQ